MPLSWVRSTCCAVYKRVGERSNFLKIWTQRGGGTFDPNVMDCFSDINSLFLAFTLRAWKEAIKNTTPVYRPTFTRSINFPQSLLRDAIVAQRHKSGTPRPGAHACSSVSSFWFPPRTTFLYGSFPSQTIVLVKSKTETLWQNRRLCPGCRH